MVTILRYVSRMCGNVNYRISLDGLESPTIYLDYEDALIDAEEIANGTEVAFEDMAND